MVNSCCTFWCVEPNQVIEQEEKSRHLYLDEEHKLSEKFMNGYGYYYFNTDENYDCIEF